MRRASRTGTWPRTGRTLPANEERVPTAEDLVIRAFRVSGYVPGPCSKCGKEERGLVMFDDYGLGWECLACGEIGRADRVEWIDGSEGDPTDFPVDL